MSDAVVSLLLEKLLTFLIDEGCQLLEFEEQFDKIRKEFQHMQSFIKDADRVKRKDRTETLKVIMNDLRELIYDTEEITTDCQLLSQQKKQGWASCSFSPTHLKSRYAMGRKLRYINKRIEEVKQNMITYLGTVPDHGSKEVGENILLTYPILMNEDRIVGLEDESRTIINWLLEKSECLKVVGIVGMAGIGKTTLAQKIFKSEVIETNFKHMIFVTVSQSFRFDELLKKMLNKLGAAHELHGKGVDDLLEILKKVLDDKYLVVLDDVWGVDEGQWWESLASALPKEKGGRVIVTTRNEDVARSVGAMDEHIHHVQILSNEKSWSLFCKIAFARNGGISPSAELEKHGKEIVAKCGGLPLTIKAVGGMMMGKGDCITEWERISKHFKEEMTDSKKDEVVISSLELSYEELPGHLRPCLLCFAMFPEDYEPGTSHIIGHWIAEGFVWGRKGKSASQIGEECLNELSNRCLILKNEQYRHGSAFSYYTVHDAVRDMLIKIATEESSFSVYHRDKRMASELSRRVVVYEKMSRESILNIKISRLRTLFVLEVEENAVAPILEANLHKFRRLRTLELQLATEISTVESAVASTRWLKGIGSLQHLAFLFLKNVDGLRTLPDSIGNLRNLQLLIVDDCHNLESLPDSIAQLEKLTILNMTGCESIERLPEGLGKLPNLERLECIKSRGGGVPNSLLSLSELQQLKKLRLLNAEISEERQAGEEESSVLRIPESLQFLTLCFPGVSFAGAAGIARKMDRPLYHPLQCLKELTLVNYPGESMPAWLSPTSLPSLRYLRIGGGGIKNLGQGFFAGGGAWKLETLVLVWLEEFEEDWANIQRAVPSLRLAHVKCCPKLKYSDEAFQPVSHDWRTWKKYIRGESSSS